MPPPSAVTAGPPSQVPIGRRPTSAPIQRGIVRDGSGGVGGVALRVLGRQERSPQRLHLRQPPRREGTGRDGAGRVQEAGQRRRVDRTPPAAVDPLPFGVIGVAALAPVGARSEAIVGSRRSLPMSLLAGGGAVAVP